MLQAALKASQPLIKAVYWSVRQRQILPLQSYAAHRQHAPLDGRDSPARLPFYGSSISVKTDPAGAPLRRRGPATNRDGLELGPVWADAVRACARLPRMKALVLAGPLMGGDIERAVREVRAQGLMVVSLNMAGSVPAAADLVVTDPLQAGVMTVMAVAETAKFSLARLKNRVSNRFLKFSSESSTLRRTRRIRNIR